MAIAYDAERKELGRARQWVNRPRPTAEASLVLEGAHGGSGRVAQLTWRALAREAPASVTATFDGTPIPVSDPARIELPPHEPAQIHFLKTVLENGLQLKPWPRTEQRIADAVAAAGLAAAGWERRRAVVLLLGPGARNGGDLTSSEAGRFLVTLRVPLFAWSIGKSRSSEPWAAATAIRTAADFDVAVTRLRAELRRQRILWVEGAHLPQAVTLTPRAEGVRLAR